jgi:hypothetical protein
MTYSVDVLLIDNVKRLYKAELAIKNMPFDVMNFKGQQCYRAHTPTAGV